METKWTPGPWVVVEDQSAAGVRGFPCIDSSTYTVVGTEGMFGDKETDFANAHLIAAAPELYEALAILEPFFINSGEARTTRWVTLARKSPEIIGRFVPAMLAALRKARGETNA